jgi:hypothetical protein
MGVEAGPREDGRPVTGDGPNGAVENVPGAAEIGEDASAEVMRLLGEGVPLALLADLAAPGGPSSPDILEDEGLPDVEWWGGREPADGGEVAD